MFSASGCESAESLATGCEVCTSTLRGFAFSLTGSTTLSTPLS